MHVDKSTSPTHTIQVHLALNICTYIIIRTQPYHFHELLQYHLSTLGHQYDILDSSPILLEVNGPDLPQYKVMQLPCNSKFPHQLFPVLLLQGLSHKHVHLQNKFLCKCVTM